MTEEVSEKEIQRVISQVKHPAVDHTLVDLGIVKEISVKEGRVTIIMAFPSPNIPIKDYLVNSVREPIEGLGAEVEIKPTVMGPGELERFLAMEQEGWKGGM